MIAAFAGVIALGALSPGPDFAVVLRQAAVSGRSRGMASAGGVAVGVFGWAVAAATGVAALLAASATAFTVVKLVGAGYLAYLGIKALRAATRRTDGPALTDGDGQLASVSVAFRQGLLCNVLNPKAAVFFVALMPQFLGTGAGVGQALILAVVAAAVTLLWFFVVANVVATLRRLFARRSVRRALDAVTGVALIGLGARLAVTRL
ncbi:lysine transporter LysE [Micromonospora endophytica]|uniref:Lysine transporter LysE n=2 Tax=Micromonospora endophytica TaxID=515350 RepID=A0A2W2BYX3_9ACTN|nr:lysine transporter LysE [Micromonospora endophytica]RIW42776.1 LysE family translocator [Micromonospora endophytica]